MDVQFGRMARLSRRRSAAKGLWWRLAQWLTGTAFSEDACRWLTIPSEQVPICKGRGADAVRRRGVGKTESRFARRHMRFRASYWKDDGLADGFGRGRRCGAPVAGIGCVGWGQAPDRAQRRRR